MAAALIACACIFAPAIAWFVTCAFASGASQVLMAIAGILCVMAFCCGASGGSTKAREMARVAVVLYLLAIAFGAGGTDGSLGALVATSLTASYLLLCALRAVCAKEPNPPDLPLSSIPTALPAGAPAQWATAGTPHTPLVVAPQCVLGNYREQYAAISSWAVRPLDEALTAARSGDVAAQALVGQGLARGVAGMTQDFAQALPMLQAAASRNVADAQVVLASVHAHGLGVPVDRFMAARLNAIAVAQLEEAAADGFGPARKHLIGLANDGVGEAIAALRRLERAPDTTQGANVSNPLIVTRMPTSPAPPGPRLLPPPLASRCALGDYRAQQAAIARWSSMPFETIVSGANNGDVAARSVLAQSFIGGLRGAPQNAELALAAFREAAAGNLADAQLSLGAMYKRGIGVPVDAAESERYFVLGVRQLEEAAALGDAGAIAFLRRLAAEGVAPAGFALWQLRLEPAKA